MANFLGGVAGGAAGTLGGGLASGLLGAIGGLFGLGKQHEDPTLRALRAQQQDISNRLMQYGTSVPGSAPDELFGLSQARGNLGQQQRQLQQRTFANYNPQQGLPAAQMLANLGNAGIAQQMALQSGYMQDASANRRQALQEAAKVGQGAANLYRPQQSQFPAVAGQLAQLLAYQQARNKGGAGGGTTAQPTQTSFGGVPVGIPPAGPIGTGQTVAPGVTGFVNGVPIGGGAPLTPTTGGEGPGSAGATVQSLMGGPVAAAGPAAAMTNTPPFDPTMMGAIAGLPPELLQYLPPNVAQMLAFLQQQHQQTGSGSLAQPLTANQVGPGLQGSMSPGNEPFGQLSTQNQIRQSSMIPGIPTAGPGMLDAAQVNQVLRTLIMPRGTQLSY